MRDLPDSGDLLKLARELLLGELLPLLPPERHRDAHLIATAIAIAAREAEAGQGWEGEVEDLLMGLYAGSEIDRTAGVSPANAAGTAAVQGTLSLARLADDLRRGAFETCLSRA